MKPSSTRMTRVLDFRFRKETVDINKEMVKFLRDLNQTLEPTLLEMPKVKGDGDAATEILVDGDAATEDMVDGDAAAEDMVFKILTSI